MKKKYPHYHEIDAEKNIWETCGIVNYRVQLDVVDLERQAVQHQCELVSCEYRIARYMGSLPHWLVQYTGTPANLDALLEDN